MAEQTRTRPVTATRTLGGLALLVIGGVHYQQYRYAFYSSIPTIGPLFLLNFVAGTALGLFLIVPIRPGLGRLGKLLDQLAALAGLGVAAGALVALLISEHTPLFGFMEHGYRFVIVLTIAADSTAIVMLTLFLVYSRRALPHEPPPAKPLGGPTKQRPMASVSGEVARHKLYEITIPGLSVAAELPAIRHRLLADFPGVLEVLATTTPATVLIVYCGVAKLDPWLDALSDSVVRRQTSVGEIRPAHNSSAA
jgi:hypothetical protein